LATAAKVVSLVVVLAVAAAGIYLASSSSSSSSRSPTTSTVSTSTTLNVNTTVISVQLQKLTTAFNNRDVATLASYYAPRATVTWVGNTQGFGGIYQNQTRIELLYAATIGQTTTDTVKISNITTKAINPNTIDASMDIFISGRSNIVGFLNATIAAQQQWVNQGGNWVIQSENWNYVVFSVQTVGEATVFPQWSLQLSGQNPELSQMHVMEWNWAPYLAAAVYLLLVVIAVAALLRARSRTG